MKRIRPNPKSPAVARVFCLITSILSLSSSVLAIYPTHYKQITLYIYHGNNFHSISRTNTQIETYKMKLTWKFKLWLYSVYIKPRRYWYIYFLQQQNIPKELRVWFPIQNKLLCEVQDFGDAHVSGSKL